MACNDRSSIRDLSYRLDQLVKPLLPVDSAKTQDIEAFGYEPLHICRYGIRRESTRGIDAIGNHRCWCECETEISKRPALFFGRQMNTGRLFEIVAFDEM